MIFGKGICLFWLPWLFQKAREGKRWVSYPCSGHMVLVLFGSVWTEISKSRNWSTSQLSNNAKLESVPTLFWSQSQNHELKNPQRIEFISSGVHFIFRVWKFSSNVTEVRIKSPFIFLQKHLMERFSTAGDFIPLMRHLARSGNIFGCHRMGMGRWGWGWEAGSLQWGENRCLLKSYSAKNSTHQGDSE